MRLNTITSIKLLMISAAFYMSSQLTAAESIEKLLKPISSQTTWSQLDEATKQKLETQAETTLKNYEAEFSYAGLMDKAEKLVKKPTGNMMKSFRSYLANEFRIELGENNTQSIDSKVRNSELVTALKYLFIGRIATTRTDNYGYIDGYENMDWNGEKFFGYTAFNLASIDTLMGQKEFGKEIEKKLAQVNVRTLSDFDKKIYTKAEIFTRQITTATHGNLANGSNYIISPWGQGAWTVDLIVGLGGDKPYFDKDSFLEASNAWFFRNLINKNQTTREMYFYQWLDVDYLVEELTEKVGDPATNELAKMWKLMLDWHIERVKNDTSWGDACTIYSKEEQNEMWKAFTAGMLIPKQEMGSLTSYARQVNDFKLRGLNEYKHVVNEMIDNLPPNILDFVQKDVVTAKVNVETRFGIVLDTAYETMDAVTGNSLASTYVKAQFSKIITLGGGYADDADDSAIAAEHKKAYQEFWKEVRSWLVDRYSGYKFDPAKGIPESIELSTDGQNYYDTIKKVIHIDVSEELSLSNLGALLIHESLHAFQYYMEDLTGELVVGVTKEGAPELVSEQLIGEFLRDYLTKKSLEKSLPYYLTERFDWLIRVLARTDGTIKVITRDQCSDGITSGEMVKQNSMSWGRTEEQAETDIVRAHKGVQYFNYIYGQTFFQNQVDELKKQSQELKDLDAYSLSACGAYVVRLDDSNYLNNLINCFANAAK